MKAYEPHFTKAEMHRCFLLLSPTEGLQSCTRAFHHASGWDEPASLLFMRQPFDFAPESYHVRTSLQAEKTRREEFTGYDPTLPSTGGGAIELSRPLRRPGPTPRGQSTSSRRGQEKGGAAPELCNRILSAACRSLNSGDLV